MSGSIERRICTWAATLVAIIGTATMQANADEFGWSRLGDGMTAKLNPSVSDMVVFDDGTGQALYACGRFESAGGVPVSNIAKWDGFEWSPVGGGIVGIVSIVTVFDDGAGEAIIGQETFVLLAIRETDQPLQD